MGLALVILAQLCTSGAGSDCGFSLAATRAAPVAPLLPRAAVGIGTGVEGFHVLGLEVLIASVSSSSYLTEKRISPVDEVGDLAGIVLGRHTWHDLPREAASHLSPWRSFGPRFDCETVSTRRARPVPALLLRAAIVALRPAPAAALRPRHRDELLVDVGLDLAVVILAESDFR